MGGKCEQKKVRLDLALCNAGVWAAGCGSLSKSVVHGSTISEIGWWSVSSSQANEMWTSQGDRLTFWRDCAGGVG